MTTRRAFLGLALVAPSAVPHIARELPRAIDDLIFDLQHPPLRFDYGAAFKSFPAPSETVTIRLRADATGAQDCINRIRGELINVTDPTLGLHGAECHVSEIEHCGCGNLTFTVEEQMREHDLFDL